MLFDGLGIQTKQAFFFHRLTPVEKNIILKYFDSILPILETFPQEYNFTPEAVDFFTQPHPSHPDPQIASIIEKIYKLPSSVNNEKLLQKKNENIEKMQKIVEGMEILLKNKYSYDFCSQLLREILLENKITFLETHFYSKQKKMFSLRFEGDTGCSQLQALREQIDFLLYYAKKDDTILIHLDSPGGSVSSYGQAAFQIKRLRDAGFNVEIVVDQVAASGGYLMACVGNKIYAPTFSIIGSIGVYMSSINFSERLNREGIYEKNFVAGQNKKNYSPFAPVTPENEKKLVQDVEIIHDTFKNFVSKYRPNINIEKVADGSVFLGEEAYNLGLIDEIKSYEEVLESYSNKGYRLYSIKATKKNFNQPDLLGGMMNALQSYQSKYSNIMALYGEGTSLIDAIKIILSH